MIVSINLNKEIKRASFLTPSIYSLQSVALENRELQTELEELRLREEALERAKKELLLQQSRAERDVQYWKERAEEYNKKVR